jgi:hypothetical protein
MIELLSDALDWCNNKLDLNIMISTHYCLLSNLTQPLSNFMVFFAIQKQQITQSQLGLYLDISSIIKL